MPIMIDVTVNKPDPNTFVVQVSGVDLRGQGSGAVVIQWQIAPATSSWSFLNPPPSTARGVVIKNPGSVFAPGSAGAKVCTWTRNNANADNNVYDYTLYLTDGTTTLQIDPSIINRP